MWAVANYSSNSSSFKFCPRVVVVNLQAQWPFLQSSFSRIEKGDILILTTFTQPSGGPFLVFMTSHSDL